MQEDKRKDLLLLMLQREGYEYPCVTTWYLWKERVGTKLGPNGRFQRFAMLRRAVTAQAKRIAAGRRSVRRMCTVSDDEDNMLDAFSRTVVGVVEKASDIPAISAHTQPRPGC